MGNSIKAQSYLKVDHECDEFVDCTRIRYASSVSAEVVTNCKSRTIFFSAYLRQVAIPIKIKFPVFSLYFFA